VDRQIPEVFELLQAAPQGVYRGTMPTSTARFKMSDLDVTVAKTRELHISAQKVFEDGNYAQAEKLYRAALNVLGTVIDPMHATYVDLLNGLLTCLEKQHKAEDAKHVELLLKQLNTGD
jgi:hypothetical protein